MSYFADIDHYSKRPCSVDGSRTCTSGTAYRHPDPAYCHPEVDTTTFGYLSAPDHDIPGPSGSTDPSQDIPPAEQTVAPEEMTTGQIETPIPSTQTSIADPSSPHDPPTTT